MASETTPIENMSDMAVYRAFHSAAEMAREIFERGMRDNLSGRDARAMVDAVTRTKECMREAERRGSVPESEMSVVNCPECGYHGPYVTDTVDDDRVSCHFCN